MFNMACHLFFNKFYYNLIVIVELAIFISFQSVSVMGLCYINPHLNFCNKISSDLYLYYCLNNNDKQSIDYDYIESNNCSLEFKVNEFTIDDIVIHSGRQNTINLYKELLQKGEMPKPLKNGNDIKCVVVGNKNLLNSTITKTIKGRTYNFYICGTLSDNTLFLGNNQIKNDIDSIKLFNINTEKINLLCNYEDVADLTTESLNAYIFGKKENIEKCKIMLEQFGYMTNFIDIVNNTKSHYLDQMFSLVTIISIAMGSIGFVTLICMTAINVENSRDVFDTYYRHGFTKGKLVIMTFIYTLFFLAFIVAFSMIISNIVGYALFGDLLTFTFWVVVIDVLFILAIIAINFLIIMNFLKMKDISKK